MGNLNSDRYEYYQRVNAAKTRKDAIKAMRREAFKKEYAKKKRAEHLQSIIWFKAPNDSLKKAQIKEGGTTIRRILGSISELTLPDGNKVLYNACAEELGFSFNAEVSGVKIFGPLIVCSKLGWEYVDCRLTRDEVESVIS